MHMYSTAKRGGLRQKDVPNATGIMNEWCSNGGGVSESEIEMQYKTQNNQHEIGSFQHHYGIFVDKVILNVCL